MEIKLDIAIESTNPVDDNAKKKALQKLADLNVDVLQKLADLSDNKKAVDTLMNPPAILKALL